MDYKEDKLLKINSSECYLIMQDMVDPNTLQEYSRALYVYQDENMAQDCVEDLRKNGIEAYISYADYIPLKTPVETVNDAVDEIEMLEDLIEGCQ